MSLEKRYGEALVVEEAALIFFVLRCPGLHFATLNSGAASHENVIGSPKRTLVLKVSIWG
jgi:hypothetical protein